VVCSGVHGFGGMVITALGKLLKSLLSMVDE
jgi:hypothetical protein